MVCLTDCPIRLITRDIDVSQILHFLGRGGGAKRVASITSVYLDSDDCSSLMKPLSMQFLFSTMPLGI